MTADEDPRGGPPSKGPNPVAYYKEGLHSRRGTPNPYPEVRWLPRKFWKLGNEARESLFPWLDNNENKTK